MSADSLVNDGWKITEAENMFVSGNSYKGLHLTVQDKTWLSVECTAALYGVDRHQRTVPQTL